MNATNVSGRHDGVPPWFGPRTLAALLPPAVAIAAVEDALSGSDGGSGTHAALAHDVERGVFHVKAAGLASANAGRHRHVYIAKINANFPGNPERGLPTIQGAAALFDADDGRLLALLDSPELTAIRTGAATAVAARHLADPAASRLLLCGAGRQAFAQVASLAVVLPALREVWIHDVDLQRATALAGRLATECGLESHAVEGFTAVSRQADVIVTCTTARSAFLHQEHVSPGTFLAAVGSDHPSKQEIDPALVAAARTFVDSPEQALACGELHHAVAAGAMRREDIAGRLDDLVRGTTPGRTSPTGITLFDSTGIALEDAAAALAAYTRWSESNRRYD